MQFFEVHYASCIMFLVILEAIPGLLFCLFRPGDSHVSHHFMFEGHSQPFSVPVNVFGKTKLIEAISFIRPDAVTGRIPQVFGHRTSP